MRKVVMSSQKQTQRRVTTHPPALFIPGGKTASGEDCALTSQELANAQKAAAAGKLPNTGVVIDPFMVSTSILALALGAMILRSARRKGRQR